MKFATKRYVGILALAVLLTVGAVTVKVRSDIQATARTQQVALSRSTDWTEGRLCNLIKDCNRERNHRT